MVNQFVAITRNVWGEARIVSDHPSRTREEVSLLPHVLWEKAEVVRLVSVESDGWAVIETADYGEEVVDAYHLMVASLTDEAAEKAAEAARWSCCPNWSLLA